MEGFFRAAAVAALAALAALMIRRQSPEFAFLASLAAGIGILLLLLGQAEKVYAALSRIGAYIPESDAILAPTARASGILILTKLTAQTCADCEQKALGAKVELAGSIACLYAALPLVERVFAQIEALL